VGRASIIGAVLPALVRNGSIEVARTMMEKELVIARSATDLRGRCRSLTTGARFFSRTGDEMRACLLARELLEMRVSLGEDRGLALAFLTVGEVLLARSMAGPAARLWATAERLLTDQDHEPPPVDRNASNELREKLVQRMDTAERNQEIRAGAALTLEEAISLARVSLTS
jgi:hypothetical protein